MTKRRRYSRPKTRRSPRRSWIRRRFHRADKRFPLSAGIGLGVSLVAPPSSGWGSTLSKITEGKMDEALQSFVASWTGLKIGGIGGQSGTEMNIGGLINPFDFNTAPAAKSMFWSAIAFKIMKKLTKGDPIKRVPIVGKMVKMS